MSPKAPAERAGERTAQTYTIKKIDVQSPVDAKTGAKILGISTQTMYRWTAQRLVPCIKYDVRGGGNGPVRYLVSDLIEFRDRFRQEAGREEIEADVDELISTI